MIAMLRHDFTTAGRHLKQRTAKRRTIGGIIKSLGYSYAWSGDVDGAQSLLSQIPEAQEELDVYIWWWDTQGYNDLSENAVLILGNLKGNTT